MPRGVPKPRPGKKIRQAIYTRHCPLNYVVAMQLIHDADITDGQLQRQSGLSRPTIQAIRQGKRKKVWYETVEKLARGLGVPVGMLMIPKEDE